MHMGCSMMRGAANEAVSLVTACGQDPAWCKSPLGRSGTAEPRRYSVGRSQNGSLHPSQRGRALVCPCSSLSVGSTLEFTPRETRHYYPRAAFPLSRMRDRPPQPLGDTAVDDSSGRNTGVHSSLLATVDDSSGRYSVVFPSSSCGLSNFGHRSLVVTPLLPFAPGQRWSDKSGTSVELKTDHSSAMRVSLLSDDASDRWKLRSRCTVIQHPKNLRLFSTHRPTLRTSVHILSNLSTVRHMQAMSMPTMSMPTVDQGQDVDKKSVVTFFGDVQQRGPEPPSARHSVHISSACNIRRKDAAWKKETLVSSLVRSALLARGKKLESEPASTKVGKPRKKSAKSKEYLTTSASSNRRLVAGHVRFSSHWRAKRSKH